LFPFVTFALASSLLKIAGKLKIKNKMGESQVVMKLKSFLVQLVQRGGSDIHFSVGDYPIFRVDGDLQRLENEKIVSQEDTKILAKELLTEEQLAKLEKDRSADFSIEVDSGERFRANMFHQKGNLSLVLRYIPNQIKDLSELSIPENIYEFMEKTQGLLLITGPTGCGKTTTLAALIDYLNNKKQRHIITIEDPVEYVYQSKYCLIEQREIHKDASDFTTALRACFREDVDVVLVGEMRELETISTAVTAAETGHLVLATLHTNDASQTIDRIIDVFPAYQQNQIRSQLSSMLLGVVSQRLLRKIGGGRIPAVEIMKNNLAIANLIRQNQIHQISGTIDTSLEDGMININRSLAILVREGRVEMKEAERYATDVDLFRLILEST